MDFIKNLSPRLSFVIYGAAAVTMAFFWLIVPEYSINLGWSSAWFNGLRAIGLLCDFNRYVLAFMLFGNFILPGVALLLSWRKRQLDWLWTSIAFGYYFTTGVVFACNNGMGLTFVWYFMFMFGAAWGAFSFLRRGLPAHL